MPEITQKDLDELIKQVNNVSIIPASAAKEKSVRAYELNMLSNQRLDLIIKRELKEYFSALISERSAAGYPSVEIFTVQGVYNFRTIVNSEQFSASHKIIRITRAFTMYEQYRQYIADWLRGEGYQVDVDEGRFDVCWRGDDE